jgi:hypothetical protein
MVLVQYAHNRAACWYERLLLDSPEPLEPDAFHRSTTIRPRPKWVLLANRSR